MNSSKWYTTTLKYYICYILFGIQVFIILGLHLISRPKSLWKYITGQVWNKNEGFSSSSTSDDVMNQFGEYLNNKVIIITGATSGIGKELILSLFRYIIYRKKQQDIEEEKEEEKEKEKEKEKKEKEKFDKLNFIIKKIIITYRDKKKLKELEKSIQNIINQELPEITDSDKNNLFKNIWLPLECDLTSLESIDIFVQKVEQLNIPIDIFINNAGVLADRATISHSIQGFEMMFGVNYIAPFYMAILFHKLFKRSLEKNQCKDGIRVIHVASNGHLFAPIYPRGIRFGKEIPKEEIIDPNAPTFRPAVTHENYIFAQCYGESKLAMILNAKELNRRYLKENVNICCHIVHPGPIPDSMLYRSQGPVGLSKSMWPFTKTSAQGAASILYAALHPSLNKALNNQWIVDCRTEELPWLGFSRDSVLAEKLWKYTLKRIREQYKPIPG